MTDSPQTTKSIEAIRLLFRAAWNSTVKERLKLWLFIIFFVLSNVLELLVPWAIGYTLSVLVSGGIDGISDAAFINAMWGVGGYFVLRLSHTILHHIARHLQNQVSYSAKMFEIQQVFHGILCFPLSWHIRSHSGESLSKLFRAAGAVESTIGTYVWQIVEGLVKVVFASIAIMALDFWVALNVTITGAISIFGMVYFNRRLTLAYRANNSFVNKINRICVDYLSHLITVKTLSLEPAAERYLADQEPEGMVHCRRISRFSELKWSMTGIGYSLVISSSLAIYFYGHKVRHEAIDIAAVYVLLNYLDRIFQAIGSFTGYYSGIIEASIAYEDATDILSQSAALPVRTSVVALPTAWQSLNIDSLSFSYVPGEPGGLHDLAVAIKRGEKIALVGPSGGGKSTLLKVLGGVIMPHTVSIGSDTGVMIPIEDVSERSLLVPQEPEVFSESLHYNLTMGEQINEQDISKVISLCRLDRVVEKLPNGIHSFLAENGRNLSVGEKQRVALARGLLRLAHKEILLLDEPTSSLDPATERLIFEHVLGEFKERTVITACHRLNLMPLFDKIVYIAGGRVEEMGHFDTLRRNNGPFQKAWEEYEQGMCGLP